MMKDKKAILRDVLKCIPEWQQVRIQRFWTFRPCIVFEGHKYLFTFLPEYKNTARELLDMEVDEISATRRKDGTNLIVLDIYYKEGKNNG